MVKKLSLILGIVLALVSMFSYYKWDDINFALKKLSVPSAVSISSKTMTLTPIDVQKDLYSIKMHQVSPLMRYSDVGHMPAWKDIQLEEGFRKGWHININSKNKFVTGAQMTCYLLSNPKTWVKYDVQLTLPIYDPKAQTLSYEAILKNIPWDHNPTPLPKSELKLGQTRLFIIQKGVWFD